MRRAPGLYLLWYGTEKMGSELQVIQPWSSSWGVGQTLCVSLLRGFLLAKPLFINL